MIPYCLQNIVFPNSASMAIQFRASEALCVLAFFTPAAIGGLTVGCVLFNLSVSGALPLDVPLGGLATFLAVWGMYATRKVTVKGYPLLGVLLPAITIGFNNAVLAEASMSYLGIGVGHALHFLVHSLPDGVLVGTNLAVDRQMDGQNLVCVALHLQRIHCQIGILIRVIGTRCGRKGQGFRRIQRRIRGSIELIQLFDDHIRGLFLGSVIRGISLGRQQKRWQAECQQQRQCKCSKSSHEQILLKFINLALSQSPSADEENDPALYILRRNRPKVPAVPGLGTVVPQKIDRSLRNAQGKRSGFPRIGGIEDLPCLDSAVHPQAPILLYLNDIRSLRADTAQDQGISLPAENRIPSFIPTLEAVGQHQIPVPDRGVHPLAADPVQQKHMAEQDPYCQGQKSDPQQKKDIAP